MHISPARGIFNLRPVSTRDLPSSPSNPFLNRERFGTIQAMAGITWYRFYFRLFPGAIKGPQVIDLLYVLGRQIRCKVLVIWNGMPAHRSHLVRDCIESLKGAIQVEYLPAYAPKLNLTEYIWGRLKHHELGTFPRTHFRQSHLPHAPSSALDAAPLNLDKRVGSKLNCLL